MTSDPIYYPAPRGTAEALRQDILRNRAGLKETIEELAARVDAAEARLRREARAAGQGVVVAAAAGIATAAAVAAGRWLSSRRPSLAAPAPALIAAAGLVGGSVGYLVLRRRSVEHSRTSNALVRPSSPTFEFRDDVVDVLVAQHRDLQRAFAAVAAQDTQRNESFAQLVNMMRRHESAEQSVVHPMLHDAAGAAGVVVDRRLAEERVIDRTLAALISMGVEASGFNEGLSHLWKLVAAHAAREESEEFPLLRQNVPAPRLRQAVTALDAAAAGRAWSTMPKTGDSEGSTG